MNKVFIDGSSGTTGLRLSQRLSMRSDIELLKISDNLRKDPGEIKKFMSQADFTFLCLPDPAAKEAVQLAEGLSTRIIDTSTAHRTAGSWAYGFPELSPRHRSSIQNSRLVASPGCHASGFISLIYPLIQEGVLNKSALLSCNSLTGYSGGGNKLIAEYEAPDRPSEYNSTYEYAMGQEHKHMPEILSQCGLENAPVFQPVVGDFYAGMLVTVPLHVSQLKGHQNLLSIRKLFKAHYAGCLMVRVMDEEPRALYTNSLAGRDDMEIYVSGSDQHIVLASRFDNLGKGASGAAIQCFNLMCGLPENTGLVVG